MPSTGTINLPSVPIPGNSPDPISVAEVACPVVRKAESRVRTPMSIITLNNNRGLVEMRDGDLVGDVARLTGRSGIHGGPKNAFVELRIEMR